MQNEVGDQICSCIPHCDMTSSTCLHILAANAICFVWHQPTSDLLLVYLRKIFSTRLRVRILQNIPGLWRSILATTVNAWPSSRHTPGLNLATQKRDSSSELSTQMCALNRNTRTSLQQQLLQPQQRHQQHHCSENRNIVKNLSVHYKSSINTEKRIEKETTSTLAPRYAILYISHASTMSSGRMSRVISVPYGYAILSCSANPKAFIKKKRAS